MVKCLAWKKKKKKNEFIIYITYIYLLQNILYIIYYIYYQNLFGLLFDPYIWGYFLSQVKLKNQFFCIIYKIYIQIKIHNVI